MALDDDIRILSSVSLFKGFTPEQLRLLAFGAENLKLSAGRELFVPLRRSSLMTARKGQAAFVESGNVIVVTSCESFESYRARKFPPWPSMIVRARFRPRP